MITQKTAEWIWHCQREIEVGTKLLEDTIEQLKRSDEDRAAPHLEDAFGRRRLTAGFPGQ